LDISRIDATTLLRVQRDTIVEPLALRLGLGERLVAHVTGRLADGRLTIDVRGQALEARSALPLQAGQAVDVEVVGVGPEITLRLVGAPAVSERNLALGALATAHGAALASSPDVTALLRALDLQPWTLSATARGQLARLLGPLGADDSSAALAAELRHLLENGGMLFECRVRRWLASSGRTEPPALWPPAALANDLKVLLGLLGRAVAPFGTPGTTADSTLPASGPVAEGATDPRPQSSLPGRDDRRGASDNLRQRVVDLVNRETEALRLGDRPTLETLRTEHARLRDELQSRQIEVAYHWVRDGTLALGVPLAFGDDLVQAWLRYRHAEDTDDSFAGTDAPVHVLDLALEPPGLGALRAHVAWSGRHVRVHLFAEARATGLLIESALPELRASLAKGGFTRVQADVTIDAAKARLDPLPPVSAPQGGSIVDVRA
jgi:hypothetical protein